MLGLQGLWILAGSGAITVAPALLVGALIVLPTLGISAWGKRVPAGLFWLAAVVVLGSSVIMAAALPEGAEALLDAEPGWTRTAMSIPLWLSDQAPLQLASLATGWAAACTAPVFALITLR